MANSSRRAFGLSLLLAAALATPSASAWSLPTGSDPAVPPAFAAWTTALAPRAFPGDAAAAVASAAGCALGDVSGDGVADILVLVADPAGGAQRLQALAGPGFEEVVWQKASRLGQVLQCAPDLDLDGTLDPIVHTLGEATGTAAGGAVDQARHQVQQVLDGASGDALLGRVDAETVTGAASQAGAVAQQATSTLLPAAAGAAAYLQTESTKALVPLPAGLPVPVDSLTATATAAAQLQVLDAAGAVVATISIDEAGVQPLAIAPLPLTGGLPDVAVLTSALTPVQEAAAGVPELALYAADGTLAWATQLPASTGLPVLLPQAGDLDLDGVGDLIVTTVQRGVETAPGSAYQVLSGVDGSVLLDSGPAVSGLMAALPLGQLPGGDALLQVASVESAGRLALSALDGAGTVLWSVDVAGLAEPANAVLDPHTGDLVGFTDLGGDGVPDVAVAVRQGSDLLVQAIDGLSGRVSWNATVPGADRVVPLAVGAASAAAGRAAGLGGEVEHAAAGASSALLALGSTAAQATLSLVDPLTGELQWTAQAALQQGASLARLDAQAAGDLDGDGTQDLLVTATYNGTGAPGAQSSGRSAQAAAGGGPEGSVTAVSGQTGETLYASSTDPNGQPLEFASDTAPQAEEEAEEGERNGVPGPGPAALALAVAAAGVLWRRRRA